MNLYSAYRLRKGQLYVQIGDMKLSQELKEKLIGSNREGLGLGIITRRSEPINFGACKIQIADLNQVADLNLSILAPVKFRSSI